MKYEGVSPSEYLLGVRLASAAKMLEAPDPSIREIAANAGFYNLSYFYKKFTNKYGISPKQYREMKRKH
jgi:AraC family transcriptional regulator of arabinose operon